MNQRSLQVKITAIVVLALFVGFSLIAFSAIGRERTRVYEEAERASHMMSIPILNTIYSDMMEERAELVYYLIRDIRAQKGVVRVEIIRNNGVETAFSDGKTLASVDREYGELKSQWKTPRIPQSEAVRSALARKEFISAFNSLKKDHGSDSDHSYYEEEEQGKSLFTYLVRINGHKKCDSCHGEDKGRGVLMITSSFEAQKRFLFESWIYWTILGFLMIGVISTVLIYSIRRGIIKPLEKMADAAHVISRGDFTKKIEVVSDDEIGVLASALNDMDVKLKDMYVGLEEKIQARTEELAAVNQELTATNQELIATNEELQSSYNQLEATTSDLDQANQEIKKANEEIRDSEALKTEFIQTVSQELRIPMTPLLGYIDLLRDQSYGSLSTKQKEIVEEINLCGWNLQLVVDELLEISALQSGRTSTVFDDVDINQLLSSVAKEIRKYADEKRIFIEPRLVQGPLLLSGDGRQLSEAFTHILRNSVKFTDGGGKVTVESSQRENGVEIIFRDNGIGIPKEKLGRIHEALKNREASSSSLFKGVGLGFYLVKNIVDIHSGTITIESETGKGTTVIVYLPKNR